MKIPDRDGALAALNVMRHLDAAGIDQRIDGEIGEEMLAVLTGLAQSLLPEADSATLHAFVHGMVLAYLMRGEVDR